MDGSSSGGPGGGSQGMSRAAKRRKKEQMKIKSNNSHIVEDDREEMQLFHEGSTTPVAVGSEGLLSILRKREVTDITSEQRAEAIMRILTYPQDRSEFYSTSWQRIPVVMSSKEKKGLLEGLITYHQISEILTRHALEYPHDILIGKYQAGKPVYYSNDSKKAKENGIAELPSQSQFISGDDILRAIEQGYSIRLNHPQKYDDNLWSFLSALEHEFNTHLTCEVYTSPITVRSHSQGFSPYFTQGDLFILQSDGSECWTIYGPKESSASDPSKPNVAFPPAIDSNFFVTDISSLSAYSSQKYTLEPGDCLYVPAGYVMESCISPSASTHSTSNKCVHLIIACNHSTNIVKFLNLIVPQSLFLLEKQGIEELRKSSKHESLSTAALASRSLPASFYNFMGVQNSTDEDIPDLSENSGELSKKRPFSEQLPKQRDQFRSLCRKTLLAAVDNALNMLDPAADQISKEFLSGRLPVPLTPEEEALTYGGSTSGTKSQRIYPFTKLRMLRPGIARAVVEDGMVVVYHCMDNSREMFGGVLNPLEFELDDGPAIEALLHAYPTPVMVMELPHPSEELEDKIGVAEALFKEGFLILSPEDKDDDGEGDAAEEDDDSPF